MLEARIKTTFVVLGAAERETTLARGWCLFNKTVVKRGAALLHHSLLRVPLELAMWVIVARRRCWRAALAFRVHVSIADYSNPRASPVE